MKGKVLVAEDNRAMVGFIRDALEMVGYYRI